MPSIRSVPGLANCGSRAEGLRTSFFGLPRQRPTGHSQPVNEWPSAFEAATERLINRLPLGSPCETYFLTKQAGASGAVQHLRLFSFPPSGLAKPSPSYSQSSAEYLKAADGRASASSVTCISQTSPRRNSRSVSLGISPAAMTASTWAAFRRTLHQARGRAALSRSQKEKTL
jgi:hypothetical protein